MSAAHEVTPRLAATTILVRARGDQPELLLLKRGEHARFMPNAYVFAGGALDLGDESADVYALCNGLDDGYARHSRNAACCWLTMLAAISRTCPHGMQRACTRHAWRFPPAG